MQNKAKYLNDLLTQFESEEIISKNLIDIKFEDIGSELFLKHHSNLNRLNMQEMKNILTGGEDVIMQQFVDHDKLKGLIKELFIINTFKDLVYPKIKNQIANLCSIKSYFILYHEAVLVNLLENFLYSITACQACEDYIIDVIEYAYKMISKYMAIKIKNPTLNDINLSENAGLNYNQKMENLANKIKEINDKAKQNDNEVKDLDEKSEQIDFGIAMCCINLIKYVSDHLSQLPFPVKHHMMNIKDIPVLFVSLMELKPWERKVTKYNPETKKNETFLEFYENNNWTTIQEHNLPKLQVQIFITVYNLVMNQENNKQYEITEFRQTTLLRLRKFFSQTLYDKIPPMEAFYRTLETMSMQSFSSTMTANPFIVEMVPLLSNNKMFKLSQEQINEIGTHVIDHHFKNLSPQQLKKELEPINDIYNMENMEYFMDDPKCANCGKLANSRCSRCKSEWYCCKQCQIQRWKEHKIICKTLSELLKENPNKDKKFIDEIKTKIDNNTDKNDKKEENIEKEKQNDKILIQEIKITDTKNTVEEADEKKNNGLNDLD